MVRARVLQPRERKPLKRLVEALILQMLPKVEPRPIVNGAIEPVESHPTQLGIIRVLGPKPLPYEAEAPIPLPMGGEPISADRGESHAITAVIP